MVDLEPVLGARAKERSAPAAADAVAFTGGIGIAVGVLLLSIEFFTNGHGRWPGIALFAVLIAVGYLAIGLLPREMHPAAVTLIVAGVPGAIGWWILPHADRFADVRPFIILTIVVWAGMWLVPRTRGRIILVGAVALLLWIWVIGEVAGNDAYSWSPVPSPPAYTSFSLSAMRTDVTIEELDPSDTLYPTAQACDEGIGVACDTLYDQSEPGSDFEEFADTCGNTQPAGSGDRCAELSGGIGSDGPFDGGIIPPNVGEGSSNKSLEIGLVSLLFGIAYVGALFAFDWRRWHGLGTAFVIPGVYALFTGTVALGDAAHHAWFGGLLTFAAGIALALVGDFGGRRFTTWAGGVFAAIGVYIFAGDVTDFQKSFDDLEPSVVRPALITIAVGVALVALAWLLAWVRSSSAGSEGSPQSEPPPAPPPLEPAFPTPAPPDQSHFPTWPPAVPPPSDPWRPPPT